MSNDNTPIMGSITWTDLTVTDAGSVRDFYAEVAGWTFEGLSMGEYEDYVMKDAGGRAAAGICHARGSNADLPPQWLVYINVDRLDERVACCEALGGSTLGGIRGGGGIGRYCLIRDPAGAVSVLYETPVQKDVPKD
jgi:uncharacterized protein